MPRIELKERKPLSDVGPIIQPPTKVETEENDDTKHMNETADLSSVYSPMSVDHDKSTQSSCHSLTAHRLSCDIDVYTCELYSYLRNVEVIKHFLFGLYE